MATSSSGDVARMAERVWGMLDQLAEDNPEEYQRFVGQQLKEGGEMFIPPQPVFCLRCNITGERSCKLYINVCKWNRVPKPKTDEDPIPVKGGALRHITKDKRKTRDLVIDIAFSPYVLEECMKQTLLEDMLISLSLDFVEEFTKLQIERKSCRKIKEKFKGLPKDVQCSLDEQWRELLSEESRLDIGDSLLKQLGSLRTRDPKENSELPPLKLFPETPAEKKTKRKLVEELSSQSASSEVRIPEHSVCIKEEDSKHSKRVSVKVTLPGASSVSEVDLEVSKDDLQLRVGRQYSLALQLPAAVNEDLTKATFNSKTGVLSVTIPCL